MMETDGSFYRLLTFLIVILSIVNLGVKSQSTPCTTPSKTPGQCVPIKRCRNIYRIVSNPGPTNRKYDAYINRAACSLPNVNRSICCVPTEVAMEQTLVETRSGVTAESATPRMTTTKMPAKVIKEQPKLLNSTHPGVNLLPDECGLSVNDRISKGTATQVFSYPWMAVLQYNNGTHIVDGCGGTLINKRYVLTAAHCIKTRSTIQLVNVRLGEHTKNQDEDCNIYRDGNSEERDCADPPVDFEIESSFAHPHHNRPPYCNDIGLIRLKKDVIMQDHIKPICLPVTPELRNLQLKKFIVTGWGATENATGSDVLLEATLPIVDNTRCEQKIQQKSRSVRLTEKHICAGGENQVDTCRGDSGGPLGFSTLYNSQTRFVQFGVVSFGVISCGKDSVPGIYGRVSSHMDWILDNMKP